MFYFSLKCYSEDIYKEALLSGTPMYLPLGHFPQMLVLFSGAKNNKFKIAYDLYNTFSSVILGIDVSLAISKTSGESCYNFHILRKID